MEEQSDSPKPLWYTQNVAMIDMLEREGRGEMTDDDASFYDYWSNDDGTCRRTFWNIWWGSTPSQHCQQSLRTRPLWVTHPIFLLEKLLRSSKVHSAPIATTTTISGQMVSFVEELLILSPPPGEGQPFDGHARKNLPFWSSSALINKNDENCDPRPLTFIFS